MPETRRVVFKKSVLSLFGMFSGSALVNACSPAMQGPALADGDCANSIPILALLGNGSYVVFKIQPQPSGSGMGLVAYPCPTPPNPASGPEPPNTPGVSTSSAPITGQTITLRPDYSSPNTVSVILNSQGYVVDSSGNYLPPATFKSNIASTLQWSEIGKRYYA